jgi:cytochrome b subunit of formate dehydrogenase
MEKEESVTVTRHSLEHRIWHWVFFITMGVLVLTGLQIYFGFPIFGAIGLARSWHMLFAYLAAFWAFPIFLYFYWVTGELKELLPGLSDVSFFLQMTKNFLGLSTYYPEHSTFDTSAGKYFQKYNPGQKVVYWGILFFLLVQGVTGFMMFWPDTFTLVVYVLGGVTNVRALHLVLMYAIISLVAMHIYMSLIPQNREALKSMFTGRASERIHKTS